MKLDKIFLFILASLIAAACADLNYTEQNTRDEEWNYEYFGEGIKNMVYDAYAQVYNQEFASNSTSFLAGATDEAMYALETGAINSYVNGGWSTANPFSTTWDKSYTAISTIHMYLEKIHKTDISDWEHNAQYQNWIQQMELFPYELRFLRAYFYFELFKTYGDVPLVTTTLTNAQANNVTRTPAAEVVKFIVDELDEIAPHLPLSYATEVGAEFGRANRIAAYALKARTLLYAASPLHNVATWDEAAKACGFIIDNADAWGLKLSPYAKLWGNDSFFNQELIWGIGRSASNAFEMANYPIGVENGSSGNCPTQSFVDQYEYQDNGQTFAERHPGSIDLNAVDPYEGLDPRFALTVVKNGDEWPSNGSQKKVIETFAGGFNASPKYGATPTGYYLRKYVDGSCVTTADNQVTRRHTWIIFRLAEVYYTYAECLLREGNSAEAKNWVNEVRKRYFSASDWTVAKDRAPRGFSEAFDEDRMLSEWGLEFLDEGHRRRTDLRRFDKFTQGQWWFFGRTTETGYDLPAKRDRKYEWFPVPERALAANPGLSQNPYYAQ